MADDQLEKKDELPSGAPQGKTEAVVSESKDNSPLAELRKLGRGLGRIVCVQGPVVDVSFENPIDIPAL
jgi:hypothetical protein